MFWLIQSIFTDGPQTPNLEDVLGPLAGNGEAVDYLLSHKQ